MVEDRDQRLGKLTRAIKRSGLYFLALFIAYFAINAIYLSVIGENWLPELLRKRTLFEFVVLNLWPLPIGNCIWFIQSMFFAYLILLALDKLKLLRFYKILLIVLMVFMLITGEFAGLLRMDIFGYTYIPGGTFTRALPYILLGMLIREKQETLLKPKKGVYLLLILIGLGSAFMEAELLFSTDNLVYSGHLIGLGLAAAAMCCWALSLPKIGDSFTVVHGRSYTKRIYAICQPMAFLLTLAAQWIGRGAPEVMQEFIGIFTYIACLIAAYLIGLIKFSRHSPIIERIEEDEDDDDESDYRDFRRSKD